EGRWIAVSPDAVISIQVSGALEDLKPNDTVVVSGVPTTISAAQIQIGELPRTPFGGFGGGFPGGFGGGGFPGPFGGAQPQPFPPGAPRGFAPPAPPGGGAFPQAPPQAVPPPP